MRDHQSRLEDSNNHQNANEPHHSTAQTWMSCAQSQPKTQKYFSQAKPSEERSINLD